MFMFVFLPGRILDPEKSGYSSTISAFLIQESLDSTIPSVVLLRRYPL